MDVVVGHAALDHRLAVGQVPATAGPGQRVEADLLGIAGIMALIDRVACAELAAGGVPDQLEQLQALLRLQLGTAVVAVHQPPRLAVAQVGGARDGDQRGAAEGAFQQLADTLPDLRHLDAQGIGVLQARHRRTGGVALRVAGHGGGQRLQQVLQGDQLAEGRLYPAEALGAIGAHAEGKQADHQFQLHPEADAGLEVVQVGEARLGIEAGGAAQVAVDQDVLPGNQRLVEQQHAVVLVETTGQRVVEGTARALLVGWPAHQAQAGVVHAGEEHNGEVLGLAGLHLRRGDRGDEGGVGDGAAGGEHLRPADDDALVGLAFDMDEHVAHLVDRLAAVQRRIDDRVVEEQPAVGEGAVPGAGVLPVVAVEAGAGLQPGHERRLVVRGTPHEAVGHARPAADRLARAEQVLGVLRGGEEAVAAAALGIDPGEDVALLAVEAVVEPGDAAAGVAERPVPGDVGDPFAVEVDLATVAQAVEIVGAGHQRVGDGMAHAGSLSGRRPWRARPAGRSVALQVRVAQRRLGVDMHPPQVARRAVDEGLATVQQGQVVGDHQVVAAPAVGVVRLWVVQAAAQAGEQFAALFRGDAVVVELGGVDEAGVALDRRFAETQDREFAARVALDYRRRRAAAVVRRAALVPAAGAAPEFQLATVGQLQRRRGRAEGGAAAVAVAGRVDTVEQLEFRHRLQVHAVPVQRHVVVGEDVVLGALLLRS